MGFFSEHSADRVRHGLHPDKVHFARELLIHILHGHDAGVETQTVGFVDTLGGVRHRAQLALSLIHISVTKRSRWMRVMYSTSSSGSTSSMLAASQ